MFSCAKSSLVFDASASAWLTLFSVGATSVIEQLLVTLGFRGKIWAFFGSTLYPVIPVTMANKGLILGIPYDSLLKM